MILKIITAPHPILLKKAKPVKKIDQKIKKLVNDMIETLKIQKDPQGVGLAAPQVGKDLAIFIIKPTKKSKPQVFINPKILKIIKSSTKEKKKKSIKLEGCLSVPKIWGVVKRANKVLLEYQDLSGRKKREWFSGFQAIIIQHEVDHLNGILFTKRVIQENFPLYEENNGKLKKLNLSL